ncbi:MAG: LysR substrate-binding domain-containing protein [Hyphomicrobiaceae bacterium]|nr:LysR substrate-binding domain-containing protein [Hyphomicrobiaceae bacterium]
MLNLAHVRSFLVVVDTRGIRAAAKTLELSPSTVVEHVKQLEEHLAAPLLLRENRAVKPTQYGMRFLPYARALVGTALRARELIHEPVLRVAAASNIGVYLLQPPITAFRRRIGIEVEMWIGPNPEVAERLERGEADVAAMEWWDNRAGFAATTWKLEPLVVIVSPDHRWARLETIPPKELLNETLLGGETGSGTGRVLKEQLGEVADRLRIRSGFGSTEAVKRAVQAGAGASIVMRSSVADEVDNGRLVARLIEGAPLVKDLKLVLPDQLPSDSPSALLVRALTID